LNNLQPIASVEVVTHRKILLRKRKVTTDGDGAAAATRGRRQHWDRLLESCDIVPVVVSNRLAIAVLVAAATNHILGYQ